MHVGACEQSISQAQVYVALKLYRFTGYTVNREFFASGNFGGNATLKVGSIFTESYFRFFKDCQWRRLVGFIFRCVYFWPFQGGRELSEN